MLNIEQMHYNVFTSKCYLSAVPRRSARPAPAGSPRVARRRREAALDLRCDRIRSTTVPAPLDAGASRGTRVCRACRACIRGTRSSFCLRGRRVRCRDSWRRLCGDCGGGWLSAVAPRLGFSAHAAGTVPPRRSLAPAAGVRTSVTRRRWLTRDARRHKRRRPSGGGQSRRCRAAVRAPLHVRLCAS